jgi:hypothetical protein
MLVMPVVVSVILAGCMSDSQEQRDEKMLRSLLNIPSTVKVLYSTTMPNPKGGKKISLGFKFDDAEYWVYTTIIDSGRWKELPISKKVWEFKDPPTELKRYRSNGFYTCKVFSGQTMSSRYVEEHTDFMDAPSHFDGYYIAVMEIDALVLHVVYNTYR